MFNVRSIQMTAKTASLIGEVNSVSVTSVGAYTSPPTGVTLSGGGGTGATASLTVGGAVQTGSVYSIQSYSKVYDFSSATPSAVISGGGGSGATAVANVTGIIYGVSMSDEGWYTSSASPSVAVVGGGGSGGAVGVGLSYRTVSVGNLHISSGGSNYSANPTLTVNAPNGMVSPASVSATVTNGVITGVHVDVAGEYYTNGNGSWMMSISVSDSTGGGADIRINTANPLSWKASPTVMTAGWFIINEGSGYTSAPALVFSGGSAVRQAAGTAIMGKRLTSFSITNGGAGYTSNAILTLSGGTPSDPSPLTAYTSAGTVYQVTSVTVTNRGSGYTSAPSVTFVGGSGTPATATAFIV